MLFVVVVVSVAVAVVVAVVVVVVFCCCWWLPLLSWLSLSLLLFSLLFSFPCPARIATCFFQ